MAVLPLFPLQVALFPGAFLPLHIFEPRYRRLLADQVESGHRFVILPPGTEGGPPSQGTIGTVARIRAVQPLADGRSNIVVSGEQRIALTRAIPGDAPYLVGEVDDWPDLVDTQMPSSADLARLRDLGQQYAEALAILEKGESDREWSDEGPILSFQIAALMDWEFPAQHRFLGLRSATERITRLLGLLPGMITAAVGHARVHQRAAHNGTGQH